MVFTLTINCYGFPVDFHLNHFWEVCVLLRHWVELRQKQNTRAVRLTAPPRRMRARAPNELVKQGEMCRVRAFDMFSLGVHVA